LEGLVGLKGLPGCVSVKPLLPFPWPVSHRPFFMETFHNNIQLVQDFLLPLKNIFMAEITSNAGHKRQKGSVRRSKKLSTKVDLTPMVDLGFLLITFFIFTTTMSQPTAMKLFLPAGEKTGMPTGASTALTVIPVADNKVFYYHGDLQTALKENLYGTTTFSVSNGVGDVIRQKQIALEQNQKFTKKDLMLIIKPAMDARYQNVVAALDEVLINDLKHYAFVDLDPVEKETLAKLGIK
jgi:biopolymer transport protein ExbD